jgi:hypothetical protein
MVTRDTDMDAEDKIAWVWNAAGMARGSTGGVGAKDRQGFQS